MSQHEWAATIPASGGASGADTALRAPAGNGYPSALERLLRAPADARDEAWAQFHEEYHRLLLHAARTTCRTREATLDAYAHVLDRLRDDDYRRLRAYTSAPACKFSTWLVVVARRICIDLQRARYGRERPGTDEARARRHVRRTLNDFVVADRELATIADEGSATTDDAVLRGELADALSRTLDALPPRDRLLLRLRFDDDLPASEIARVLHLPTPFHVYRRIRTVLFQLRQRLESLGFDGRDS